MNRVPNADMPTENDVKKIDRGAMIEKMASWYHDSSELYIVHESSHDEHILPSLSDTETYLEGINEELHLGMSKHSRAVTASQPLENRIARRPRDSITMESFFSVQFRCGHRAVSTSQQVSSLWIASTPNYLLMKWRKDIKYGIFSLRIIQIKLPKTELGKSWWKYLEMED
ncbi:unnamed protein product [Euphydryas editha]|uniref:Uncharacterized protein n=1 Tax=Euphydryas editha TaxID=104508 RepID=A0AAU9UPB3_EUPED|nr:unnamed protein product [Euphydryas editha]